MQNVIGFITVPQEHGYASVFSRHNYAYTIAFSLFEQYLLRTYLS